MTMSAGPVRFAGVLIASSLLATLLPSALAAQTVARLRVAEENFRKTPNGTQLATVLQDAELPVVGEQGRWVEVELSGWIWSPSVVETDQEGFDLRVSAQGGENLRAAPQGEIVARLLEGCLLERLESDGNWHHVQRRGWLWRPSLQLGGSPPTPEPSSDTPSATASDTTSPSASEPSVFTSVSRTPVLTTPDGDTVALFQPGGQAQILGRTGDWIRVRLDGWVYGPAALDSLPDLADTGDLTPAQLRANPGRYKGALVRWRVRVISLMRAERARTDFEEGEPFLLASDASGDAGFVYLAVPEALLPQAEKLEPLQHVTVVGRVRTGRSSQVGSPVIDLTDIEVEAVGR